MARGFSNRTYRMADDGQRIEGTWRHVFIHNGPSYFLTDLKIYADGLIDCWGLVTMDEFKQKVRSGWVATEVSEGEEASAFQLGEWRFHDAHLLTADLLIGEAEETLAELQGGPSATDRFNEALDGYLRERTEDRRIVLREAFLAIPAHLRRFVLGDQDWADWPVRVLIGELGEPLMPRFPPFEPRAISEQDREGVFRYFDHRRTSHEQWRAETNDGDADGPRRGTTGPTIGEGPVRFDHGWIALERDNYLANDARISVVVEGTTYASVAHAYWALSTDDQSIRKAVREAPTPHEARDIALRGVRRGDWPQVRLAVMAGLVRLKFNQHPDLAQRLMATGTARITAIGQFSDGFWSRAGRNWMGRLLELVRSELSLQSRG